jgi:hypothetical protein
MITLTDKETKLTEYLLNNTDGSDGHICSEQFMDLKELGWSMETLKGVFGSLVNKQILCYGDFLHDHNAEYYYWKIPVSEERQLNYSSEKYIPINSVDDLLNKLNNQRKVI